MRIIRTENYEELSRRAADLIAAQILVKPDCVLGLATGSTPEGTYKELVDRYEKGILDFSQVSSVNLDEYKGLSGDNDQSYRYFMNHHLFDHVNIDKTRTHVPNGLEPDSDKACADYNAQIQAMGVHRGNSLRGPDSEHHRGKRTLLCLHRRGSEEGLHHGHRKYYGRKEDSSPGLRQGQGSGHL